MKRSMLLKSGLVLMLCALVFTLGCGGGGSSSSTTAAGGGAAVAGVAAAGAPLVGKVYLKDSAATPTEKSVNTAADGSYSIDVTGLTAPFIIKADGTSNGKPYTLYSVATEAGAVANVNTITNIAVASAAGGTVTDPATVYNAPATYKTNIKANIAGEVKKIVDNVIAKLDTTQFAGAKDIDPMKGSFKADGKALDKVLDYIEFKVNKDYGTVTVTDKVNKTIIAAATTTGTGLSSLSVSSANATALATAASTGTKPVSALTVASKVSVLDAKDLPAAKAKMMVQKVGLLQLKPSDLSASSPFYTDESNVYVAERTSNAFDTVNEILCSIAQTKYDEMLNKGDYKAQVDKNKCSKNQDSAKQAGQNSQNKSSGSDAPDYVVWKVNSSRGTGATDPQIVKAWIHEKGGEHEPSKLIVAKLVITEGKSDTNPYGIFTINFKAYARKQDGTYDTSKTLMKGILKTEKNSAGKVVFSFIDDGGFDMGNGMSVSYTEKAAFERTADGSGGTGSIYTKDTYPNDTGKLTTDTSNFNIAFNNDYFERNDGTTDTCLSRTKFDETVWRYGLYDASGNRVNRNSGFPIKYTDTVANKDYYGWIGYWGLWFPDSVTVPNGATVKRVDYTNNGPVETPYSVIVAQGKLKKHTRQALKLSAVKNVPMDYWDNTDNKNYRVTWNGTKFQKVGYLDQASSGMWKDMAAVDMSLSSLQSSDLNFWAQSLGGQVRVKLSCNQPTMGQQGPPTFSCTAADTLDVIFYSEDIVYPSDTVPATLACLNNCPDPANMTNATTGPFFDTNSMQMQQVAPASATFKNYTFDTTSMLLKYAPTGASVVLTGQNSAQQWGVMSGPLFEANTTNLGKLKCPWDATGNTTCGWQAWSELDTFYTWETGANQWNQFTALVDSSKNVVKFDPPLQVKYVDASGATFYLDYSGFGDLQGIPGACYSWDTGQKVDCGPNTRWVPQFSILEGTEVTAGGISYLVKHLDKEQRMAAATAGSCSSAGLALATYTLPTLDAWVDPGAASDPNRVDADNEPKNLGAPSVIAGIVKTQPATPATPKFSALVKQTLSNVVDSVVNFFK